MVFLWEFRTQPGQSDTLDTPNPDTPDGSPDEPDTSDTLTTLGSPKMEGEFSTPISPIKLLEVSRDLGWS